VIGWLRQLTPLFVALLCVKLVFYSVCLAVIGTVVWDVVAEDELGATAAWGGLLWALGGAMLANIAVMIAWRISGRQIYRNRYADLARGSGSGEQS